MKPLFWKKSGLSNTCKPYGDLVHFLPYRYENSNVRCLNGSAHVLVTDNIKNVTCPKCKNKKTAKEYWSHWEKEHGKVF